MMERDEIIRLAKEAGMGTAFYSQDNEPLTEELWGGPMRTRELIRFAHLVAAEYKRDALRYRWLKENIRGGSVGTPIGWFDDDVSDWDKDIDAAMEDKQ